MIVYGSLYPWQFHHNMHAASPWMVLLRSWPVNYNRYIFKDIAVNVALYLPFGAVAYLWLEHCQGRKHYQGWVRGGIPILLALLLSCSMEMVQLYDDSRVCSLLDALTNVCGAALGVWFGARLRRVKAPHVEAVPLFLLSCWAGASLFPFMPDLSRTHLWQKSGAFFSAPVTLVGFLGAVAAWIAAERFMAVTGFWWLYLLLPLRFFVAGLSLTWLDCAAAGVAWLMARLATRDGIIALTVLASILLVGLTPFHFDAKPHSFIWVPFRALLTTNWEAGFALFFRKSFLYGSAIWLLRGAGLKLWTSAAMVAALLAFVEAAQLFLPNHVAESTDPLHAVIMAWILGKLSRNEKLAKHV